MLTSRVLVSTLSIIAVAAGCSPPYEDATSRSFNLSSTAETHPYQDRLLCERAPGSTLVGVMYDISTGSKVEVARFDWGGNVGTCELAIRAARGGKVCISESYGSYEVHDLKSGRNTGSYSQLDDCLTVTRGWAQLATSPGYVELMPAAELAPFLAALPTLSDPSIDQAIHDPHAIWYDEASLTYVYQDSFGDPKGLRGNRVGYDVGSNASEPDIHALVDYFQPGHFKLPFSISAGADFSDNVYVLDFWLPPRAGSRALPVRIAYDNSHWQWVFPVGTTVGEVFFIQAPDDKGWYAFEARTRVRAIDHWDTSVFRPFTSAAALSAAIQASRPAWRTTPDLKALVDHLDDQKNLVPFTLQSPTYAAIFPAIDGALDYLPETSDVNLIKALLRSTPFAKANGTTWKSDGAKTTYAASTHASFHIVAKEYFGGMFEVSEASCHRCHEQTSRPLSDLDPRVVLYGEVWGEDEVFTWHPFAIDEDTFSVSDGNRHMNQRFVTAGLVEEKSLTADPTIYRALKKPYTPRYE